jgi:hypothetical protein
MIEMKTPKVVGCLVCGFRSENVIEIENFQDEGCPDCNKQQMNCEMCGNKNGSFASRLYQYANGETFRALVCSACADLHDKLAGKK